MVYREGARPMTDRTEPNQKKVKYDCNGLPVDPHDWTYEDWTILWDAILTVRSKIADNHREQRESQARQSKLAPPDDAKGDADEIG